MSNHHPLCFIELTDFSYRVAVCNDPQQPAKIQEIHEFPLTETSKLAQLVPPGSELICALRPKIRQAHLASNAEANDFKGLAGMQQFAQRPELTAAEPAWFAGVQAATGQAPDEKPWLLSLSPDSAQKQARALFDHLKPKSTRYVDATILTAGALASVVASPTLLLEIGELSSQVFLVSPQGVLATRRVTLSLDQIAESVQAKFQLKFRGSAAKLFFNPDCDFSDHAAHIANQLATTLKQDLADILSSQPTPTALCCSGLPALQNWLALSLAKELGLTPFVAAAKSANGISFASPAIEATVSPAWFNFLSLIKTQTSTNNNSSPWLAEWLEVKALLSASTGSASKQPQVPVQGQPAQPVRPAAPVVVKPTPAPAPVAKPVVVAKPVIATEPVSPETSSRKSRGPLLIGVAAAVVALLVIAFFSWQSGNQKAEIEKIAQEKQNAELRLRAELEKKSQQQAATRLANAFGNLVITTEPVGALVTVGDQPPAPAPLTLNHLKVGNYPVTVSLARYDEVKLNLEVTENGTTNSGVIKLTRIAGSLELNSDPVGASYEIYSNSASGKAPKITGKTPAKITDLAPDDYTLTYSMPGWPTHTETIKVARNSTARSVWAVPYGQIKITSEPTGALVTQNGINLGRTQLNTTQPVGPASYEINIIGCKPMILTGNVEKGKTLTLNANLVPAIEGIYPARDVDTKPQPNKRILPNLPSALANQAALTDLYVLIDKEGHPMDIQIMETTNPAVTKYYVDAVYTWKFRPGIKDGKPVITRLKLSFDSKDPQK